MINNVIYFVLGIRKSISETYSNTFLIQLRNKVLSKSILVNSFEGIANFFRGLESPRACDNLIGYHTHSYSLTLVSLVRGTNLISLAVSYLVIEKGGEKVWQK